MVYGGSFEQTHLLLCTVYDMGDRTDGIRAQMLSLLTKIPAMNTSFTVTISREQSDTHARANTMPEHAFCARTHL